jgi:hypothetical protein
MDSSYFAFCSEHHLPDKTDLVILEFDAADPKSVPYLPLVTHPRPELVLTMTGPG